MSTFGTFLVLEDTEHLDVNIWYLLVMFVDEKIKRVEHRILGNFVNPFCILTISNIRWDCFWTSMLCVDVEYIRFSCPWGEG